MSSVPGTTSLRLSSSGHQGSSDSTDVDLATLRRVASLFILLTPTPTPTEMATMPRQIRPSLAYLFTADASVWRRGESDGAVATAPPLDEVA